ncbi:putative uncharacterized protein DDB_G0279653 [Leptopilina boulardi]|uniref:putative uncharacterized protein DDB_G0279653 n=1 Tax=Leptopilina boulardi TaxID=63433 RepID=UPI0021F6155A|nr:putative uncharacterized protein DDB_G0279653 [Leptopilina boulardi]
MHNSLRLCLLLGITLISGIAVVSGNEDSSVFKTVRNSNAAILNRLGLVPLEIPDGHHKKRLAGPEPPSSTFGAQSRIHQPYSRRHGHRDSHVYIVKLPASPPYYTFTKPHKNDNKSQKQQNTLANSVGFHSNGKPGKIYHWNLPLMMKIAEKKRYQAQIKMEQLKKKIQMENDKTKSDSEIIKINGNDINAIQAISNVHTSVNDIIDRKHDHMKYFNNGKYFHSSTDNRLMYGSKPSSSSMNNLLQKHSRNNDKRLSYPISLEVGSKKIKEAEQQQSYKTKNSTNKMFRLADSATYRVGVHHANDRFSAWSNNNNNNNNLSNELHGSRNTADEQKPKKHRKKAAMSYYAPLNPNKSGSTSIHKNFPGNGKPKAFYVMEKSRKPIYYHQLLP